jgi:hypothetical protein
MNTSYLIAFVVTVTLWSPPIGPSITQEQQQQQQQQQNEEERRREAERLAAERARREEERRQSEARREEFRKLRPPTLEERIATHKRLYPDFVKSVRKFDNVRREISVFAEQETLDASTERAVRKTVKSLQQPTEVIFKYVLFEGKAPDLPAKNFEMMTLEERLRVVQQMSSSVSAKVRQWMDAQKNSVVDVRQTSSLLTDLQSLKRLLQSMHQ